MSKLLSDEHRTESRGINAHTPSDEFLASTLDNMVSAREAFVTEARNIVVWASSALGAAVLVLAWSADRKSELSACGGIIASALICLCIVTLLRHTARRKLEYAYGFYVGMCIHAALSHKRAGVPSTHPWFADVYGRATLIGSFEPPMSVLFPGRRRQFVECNAQIGGRCNQSVCSKGCEIVGEDPSKLAAAWLSHEATLESTYSEIVAMIEMFSLVVCGIGIVLLILIQAGCVSIA